MHHRAPVLANKHTYIVPSYRWTPFSQKIFAGLSKNPFQKKNGNNQWQTLWDSHPLPALFHVGCKLNIKKCWLPIICPFLVFTASHSFFRLAITLSHGEGRFWITLSKSNVFFINFLMKIKSLLIILVTDCRPCSKISFNLLFAVCWWLPSGLQMPKVPGER